MEPNEKRDDALFEALNRSKKKKKRKTLRTVIIVVAAVALLLTAGILRLRRQVAVRFASGSGEVLSAQAELGNISTQVSGSGTLLNVDEESVTVPAGVTVEEVLVASHDSVTEGQMLAKVNVSTALTALDSVQTKLEEIDSEISSAEGEAVSSSVSAGVTGRVKLVYAQAGDDVAACMYDNGALAVLSVDGKMAVEIETDALSAGDSVTVVREDGTELDGSVDSVIDGKATVLVSDDGPRVDEQVSVLDGEGKTLGQGRLSIHSPLRVSAITGTVAAVYARENQSVVAGTTLFALRDTTYTAKYQSLLKDREELEEELLELMAIYRSGGVTAPFAGSVSSVDYDEDNVSSDTETALVTLSRDEQMKVSINVDESNILALELGQTATITVRSIGDDEFAGSITEINKTATTSSGVTRYSAVVTLDKDEKMLQGMTAKVVVHIEGVDNAVIIPVDALHQTSSRSYVYTSYDEETKEFGGRVDVVAGITNSKSAEIVSGLSVGDTVYYTKAEENFFGGFPSGDFSGGDFSGGDFPSGGSRPSGDFPGGGSRPSGDFSGGGFPSGGPGNGGRP